MSGGFRSGSSCWRFLLHGSRGRPSGFFGPTSCTTLLTGPSIHFSHPGEFQTCSRGDEMCNSARLNVFLFRLIPIAVCIQVVKGMARQHNSRGNETLLTSVESVKRYNPLHEQEVVPEWARVDSNHRPHPYQGCALAS